MIRKVNYIIVWFLGERRVKSVADPRYFIHRHLQFLQDNNIDVARVTVVLNTDSEAEEALARETLKEYDNYYTELVFFARPNEGFSYSGWNDAIVKCIDDGEDFTHYFLMEDDYAPGTTDFIDQYESKMVSDVGYVCQKLSDPTLSKIFNTQIHAGVSCGLLAADAARDAYRVFGSPLKTYTTKRYDWDSLLAQVHFLDNITNLGYRIVDSSDFSSVVFLHGLTHEIKSDRGWFLIEYGNPKKPRVIEPVIDWSLYEREEPVIK